MTVRVNKDSFNLREKLSELERPIGLKGSELMKSETAQDARDLVSAGRKNIIINGAMEINQREFVSRVYTNASNGVYNVDRFAVDWSLNGQITVSLENDAPTGFNKSIKFTVNTASTDNLSQSEYNTLKYNVESFDTNHLAYGTSDAKPITLSFWVKANHVGKYSAGFRSYAVGQVRGNHQSYTINSPNVWEYKTLTFPGDTEYSLPNSNDRSLQLHMAVTNGDNVDDPTDNGNWDSGNYIGLLSEGTMDDFNATAGNTIQWTGFQLEVGKNATEFEHRPYGEELALCQRYFYINGGAQHNIISQAFAPHTTEIAVAWPHPTEMRAVPTVTISSTNNNNTDFYFRTINNTGFSLTGNGRSLTQMTKHHASIWFNGMSGVPQVPGQVRVQNNRTAFIHLSAEL